MSESFELLDPTNVVAGTVGEPGDRIFFLQAQDLTTLVTLKLEKGQIHALASGISSVLEDTDDSSDPIRPTDMVEPVMAAWTVSGLGLGIDPEGGRVVIVAEELVDDLDSDDADDDERNEGATARFHMSYGAARGFAAYALSLIDYGRDFGRQNGHRPH